MFYKLSLIVLLSAFLLSCGSPAATNTAKPAVAAEPSLTGDLQRAKTAPAAPAGAKPAGPSASLAEKPSDPTAQVAATAKPVSTPLDTSSSDRKIIRNADISLEASSPENVQKVITTIAETRGGFVVDSQQRSTTKDNSVKDTVSMTVRVPAAKFTEAVDEIKRSAEGVISENIKGEDVTDQFVDIEARLRAKKATEQQFMEIMKQAKTVEDALNVQQQLGQIRTEIEQIEGKKRLLENQSSLSTIKVDIRTKAAFAESSVGFGRKLSDAFGSGVDVALSFILGLVTVIVSVLPFVVLILLPLALIVRYLIVRQRRKNESIVAEPKPEKDSD